MVFRKPAPAKGATAVAVEPKPAASEVAELEDRLRKIADMERVERETSLASERARLEVELSAARDRQRAEERDALQREADKLAGELRAVVESLKPSVLKILDGLERVQAARAATAGTGIFQLIQWTGLLAPAPLTGIIAAPRAAQILREWASSPGN